MYTYYANGSNTGSAFEALSRTITGKGRVRKFCCRSRFLSMLSMASKPSSAAALISEIPRQEAVVSAAFMNGTQATRRALAAVEGLSNRGKDRSWAVLAMLFGGLAMMRATSDLPTRAIIRSQIADAVATLTGRRSPGNGGQTGSG